MGFRKFSILFISGIIAISFFYGSFSVSIFSRLRAILVPDNFISSTSEDGFENITLVVRHSIVLVQSFSAGRLLQSGGGLILTQDGLIVTLNSLVPVGADFYQIIIEDRLNRGRVVMRNGKINLAIVAVDEEELLPIDFRSAPFKSEQLFVVSRLRELNRSNIITSPLSDDNFSQVDTRFSGGAVVDSNGKVVGIADISRKSNQLIGSNIVEEMFFKYVLSAN